MGREVIRALLILATSFSIIPITIAHAQLLGGQKLVHNVNTGLSYSTIQAAIDDRSTRDGHTIQVDFGTYSESVNVYKSIRIISASDDPSDTIVIASDRDSSVFHVTADNVSINGFSVRGSWFGIFLDNSSYCNISNNIVSETCRGNCVESGAFNTIENCTAYHNDEDGIDIINSKNTNVSYNTVSNNGAWGFLLNNSSGNLVSNNNVFNVSYDGICLLHSSRNLVVNNTAVNNGLKWGKETARGTGITIKGSSYNIASNNIACSNNRVGIAVQEGSSYNEISKNIANNNIYEFGILLEEGCEYNRITNNVACSNAWAGISLSRAPNGKDGCHHNTIVDNIANSNGDRGIILQQSNYNIVSKNFALNNKKWGITLQFGSSFNDIANNSISNSSMAVDLGNSSNNVIRDNNIVSNKLGVNLGLHSVNNSVYHNNFMNNEVQAQSWTSGNSFNNSDGEGNYWSDIEQYGLDLVDSDGDGIYDSGSQYPYRQDGGHVSEYVIDWGPYVDKFGWLPKPRFKIADLSINPPEVKAGEIVTIGVRVINTGKREGSYTVTLIVNELVEASKNVTLTGGESKRVIFELVKKEPGMYDIEVAGLKGTFAVKAAWAYPLPWGFYTTIAAFAIVAIVVATIIYKRRASTRSHASLQSKLLFDRSSLDDD